MIVLRSARRSVLYGLIAATLIRAEVTWPNATPAGQGFNAEKLEQARARLAASGTKSLLVIRGGQIVLEWNAGGRDARSKHYTASMAKALVGGTSLLLAMADGRMRPDDRAAKYIPSWSQDERKARINIRHLATHSSGLQDAHQDGVPHEKLPGWQGDFWKRTPDPFTIALRAPVLFDPGTNYHYSNPGMAALAYAVTASLRGGSHADIRTLLRERAMKPLEIPDGDWSIGYGQAYEAHGLHLWANWGGGSFTPRAAARLAEMMMEGGSWNGNAVLSGRVVEAALRYAGTPLPDRSKDPYAPASGLCWYTNFDGVWPSVPRDAFAGAGAGHQVVLAVPSLRLIVVRNGATLAADKAFWEPVYKLLFDPLMKAMGEPVKPIAPPYSQSPVIKAVRFEPDIVRKAIGSDNWPVTWGADGHLYTSYGDGWGFEPHLEKKLSLGMARVEGTPEEFRGVNLRAPSVERLGDGAAGPKASGIISVGDVLYMWVRNAGNSRLVWSEDRGKTWQEGFRFEESFGSPAFLNFGRDNDDARDEYVYTYSQNGPSAYDSDDDLVLARAPADRLKRREAWEFFAGMNARGEPLWSGKIGERKSVFRFPRHCQRVDAVYNRGLKRYLLAVGYGHDGGWGIFDAPQPWGPWTTAFHTEYWGLGGTHGYRLPSKWISEDGSRMTLIFSGRIYDGTSYDAFCVRPMTLEISR